MLSFAYNFTLSHRGFVHLSFRSLSFSELPCEFICTTQYFSFPLVKWVWKQHFVRFLWRLGRLWYAESLAHLINFSVAFSFYSSPYCHRSHLFCFVFGSLGTSQRQMNESSVFALSASPNCKQDFGTGSLGKLLDITTVFK